MNKFIIVLLSISSFTFSQTDSSECTKLYAQFSEESFPCRSIERMPEPIGGIDIIQSLLNYPAAAKKDSIEGKVYVLVIIDSLGNVLCPKIIKSADQLLDQEAIRVVRQLRFIPAMNRGKKEAIKLVIPILFKLNQDSE